MLNKKRIAVITILLVAMFALTAIAADISITSTLNGKVSSSNLVRQGQEVKEGQTLVMIESIAGTVPAARATANGTVLQVLVKPGDTVKSGQVVVKIRTAG